MGIGYKLGCGFFSLLDFLTRLELLKKKVVRQFRRPSEANRYFLCSLKTQQASSVLFKPHLGSVVEEINQAKLLEPLRIITCIKLNYDADTFKK